MKKILAILVVAMMLLSTVSALAEFEGVATDISGEVTFYTYYADASIPLVDAAVAKMAEKYPNLKINIEHRADSDGTALKTWAAVGELPDMFQVTNSDTYDTLLDNGDFYALDTALAATGYYDMYKGGDTWAEANRDADGNSYAVGVNNQDVFLCYYNISLFEELGLTEPTNFDEFKHCITVLKDAGKLPVALFAAEQWPGMGVYELACLAEGNFEGVDGVSAGNATFAGDESFLKAAEKLQEIVEMGAFGTGALSTNASQAFELCKTGEAGFVFNGSWHFDTAETEGYGDNLGWCRYNIFADADKVEEVKLHSVGGKPTNLNFFVNAKPNSGLDAEIVAQLTLEYLYYGDMAKGELGMRTSVKGDFEFGGSEHYAAFCDAITAYETFTEMPFNISNGELVVAFGNAVEMMVSGNFTAQDFIEEMTAAGF